MNYEELEKVRQRYSKKIKIFLIPAFILFFLAVGSVFAVVFSSFLTQDLSTTTTLPSSELIIMIVPLGIFLAVVLGIIGVVSIYQDRKDYRRIYKSYFVEKCLNQVFSNVQYYHDEGFPAEGIEATGMVRMGNRYRSNDLVTAEYKGVAFSQADVEIAFEGEDTTTIMFKGRWMKFEFPKKFNFRLEVAGKSVQIKKIPDKDPKTGKGFQKISTESGSFNNKLDVYAEDGFEAFYILDPVMIEKIEALADYHQGRILLCFIDKKLHIAIHNNSDAFEPPSPHAKIDEAKEIAKVANEIKTVTDLVDFLRLDKKLFKAS